jgi:hypothetical protein
MSSEISDSFAKLLGRQASDAERQQLYKVRDALDLKNNDALWLVLIALQHYQTSYEKIPNAITQASKTTLDNIKVTADAAVMASAEAAKADLAKAVASAAREVAHNTSAKHMYIWASSCIAIAFFCFAAFGWYMHKSGVESGYNKGYGAGYSETKDEKAAASWANTKEGKAAYNLSKVTSINDLKECRNTGWKKYKVGKEEFCYTDFYDENGQRTAMGWRIN